MRRRYTKEQKINMTDEERYEYAKYLNEYNYYQKKRIVRGFKLVFLPPISIGLSVVAFVCKLIGMITSIGLPYGVYCTYKVVVQLYNGTPFSETAEGNFAILFMIVPFTAFFVASLTRDLSVYLKEKN